MATTARRLINGKKKRAAKRPAAKARASSARTARAARRAAQKDAAFAAVAHITSADSAEYRKKNPVPASFWERATAE